MPSILQRLAFGLLSAALAHTKLSVRLTRGQCLAQLDASVCSAEDVNGLNDDRLHESVGPETAALLRPQTKGTV
jgi:helicase